MQELATYHDPVISLGGGAVLWDDNVDSLALTGVLLNLEAPVDVLVERLTGSEADGHPLLGGPAEAGASFSSVCGPRPRRAVPASARSLM